MLCGDTRSTHDSRLLKGGKSNDNVWNAFARARLWSQHVFLFFVSFSPVITMSKSKQIVNKCVEQQTQTLLRVIIIADSTWSAATRIYFTRWQQTSHTKSIPSIDQVALLFSPLLVALAMTMSRFIRWRDVFLSISLRLRYCVAGGWMLPAGTVCMTAHEYSKCTCWFYCCQ